jgi:hypothetical protein
MAGIIDPEAPVAVTPDTPFREAFLGGSSDGGVNFFHQDVITWRCLGPISFHKATGMEAKDRGLISCR